MKKVLGLLCTFHLLISCSKPVAAQRGENAKFIQPIQRAHSVDKERRLYTLLNSLTFQSIDSGFVADNGSVIDTEHPQVQSQWAQNYFPSAINNDTDDNVMVETMLQQLEVRNSSGKSDESKWMLLPQANTSQTYLQESTGTKVIYDNLDYWDTEKVMEDAVSIDQFMSDVESSRNDKDRSNSTGNEIIWIFTTTQGPSTTSDPWTEPSIKKHTPLHSIQNTKLSDHETNETPRPFHSELTINSGPPHLTLNKVGRPVQTEINFRPSYTDQVIHSSNYHTLKPFVIKSHVNINRNKEKNSAPQKKIPSPPTNSSYSVTKPPRVYSPPKQGTTESSNLSHKKPYRPSLFQNQPHPKNPIKVNVNYIHVPSREPSSTTEHYLFPFPTRKYTPPPRYTPPRKRPTPKPEAKYVLVNVWDQIDGKLVLIGKKKIPASQLDLDTLQENYHAYPDSEFIRPSDLPPNVLNQIKQSVTFPPATKATRRPTWNNLMLRPPQAVQQKFFFNLGSSNNEEPTVDSELGAVVVEDPDANDYEYSDYNIEDSEEIDDRYDRPNRVQQPTRPPQLGPTTPYPFAHLPLKPPSEIQQSLSVLQGKPSSTKSLNELPLHPPSIFQYQDVLSSILSSIVPINPANKSASQHSVIPPKWYKPVSEDKSHYQPWYKPSEKTPAVQAAPVTQHWNRPLSTSNPIKEQWYTPNKKFPIESNGPQYWYTPTEKPVQRRPSFVPSLASNRAKVPVSSYLKSYPSSQQRHNFDSSYSSSNIRKTGLPVPESLYSYSHKTKTARKPESETDNIYDDEYDDDDDYKPEEYDEYTALENLQHSIENTVDELQNNPSLQMLALTIAAVPALSQVMPLFLGRRRRDLSDQGRGFAVKPEEQQFHEELEQNNGFMTRIQDRVYTIIDQFQSNPSLQSWSTVALAGIGAGIVAMFMAGRKRRDADQQYFVSEMIRLNRQLETMGSELKIPTQEDIDLMFESAKHCKKLHSEKIQQTFHCILKNYAAKRDYLVRATKRVVGTQSQPEIKKV